LGKFASNPVFRGGGVGEFPVMHISAVMQEGEVGIGHCLQVYIDNLVFTMEKNLTEAIENV
jgi:hypothetical protein